MTTITRSDTKESEDRKWMRLAIRAADKAWGQTTPNPPVGCVLVKNGVLIATGQTSSGGRPHAEANALKHAGSAARGATAYVTLEPCSHYGKSPPCADALINAGISRCVIASGSDPDPRVSGRGTERLRQAGIQVEIGLLADQAEACHGGFFKRMTEGKPRLTLKLATSLDGRIACANGKSQWITGEAARRHVHLMRYRSDAVLIGIGTLLADNPRLTHRLPKKSQSAAPQPIRIILDSHLKTSPDARIFDDISDAPVAIVCQADPDPVRHSKLLAAGAELVVARSSDRSQPFYSAEATSRKALMATALDWLAERGCNDVLCEGGGHVAAHLLMNSLVDELAWFRAPLILGGDGLPAISDIGVTSPQDAMRLQLRSVRKFGEDRLESYQKLSKSSS